MRKLYISAALSALLLLLVITTAGCNSERAFVPTPNPTPTPTPQPAKAPMGALIEDMGTVMGSTAENMDTSSIVDRNLYIATNDGTGLTKVNDQLGDFHSVYVLPDGSKGVIAAHAADGYSQIYYLSPVESGSQPIQLTSTPVDKTSAVLSADGSKIVFLQLDPVQNPDFPRIWDVAVMDLNGSNLRVITPPLGWHFLHPFFSPDGSTIAVALDQGSFGGDMGIFMMNPDGSALKRLTPGGANGILGVAPAFSLDGKQVVFSSVGWNDLSIYIVNIDGTGLKRIGKPNAGWGDPLFVGDRIMFVSNGDIYSMKSDGTDVRQVTKTKYEDAFEMSID